VLWVGEVGFFGLNCSCLIALSRIFEEEGRLEEALEGCEGEAVEGEAVEGEAVEGEAVEGEAVEGEAVEGEGWDGEREVVGAGDANSVGVKGLPPPIEAHAACVRPVLPRGGLGVVEAVEEVVVEAAVEVALVVEVLVVEAASAVVVAANVYVEALPDAPEATAVPGAGTAWRANCRARS
jgi:hypothetical protein